MKRRRRSRSLGTAPCRDGRPFLPSRLRTEPRTLHAQWDRLVYVGGPDSEGLVGSPEDTDLERISLPGPRIKDLRRLFVIESGARSRSRTLSVLTACEYRGCLTQQRVCVGARDVLAGTRRYGQRDDYVEVLHLAEILSLFSQPPEEEERLAKSEQSLATPIEAPGQQYLRTASDFPRAVRSSATEWFLIGTE